MNRPEPQLPEQHLHATGFARDLLDGLAAFPKAIPSKWFYDAQGSALFERICTLPEYYPTRVETALLARHAEEFAGLAGAGASLVEFGAGSLRKAKILLGAMAALHSYVPVDISGAFLRQRVKLLAQSSPGLTVHPVEADFTAPMVLPAGTGHDRIGFFPGSTIGNFAPEEAIRFLREARAHIRAMLVGVDLVKEPAVLHAAYNDAAGVTAAFNRNVLERANREVGADFEPGAFAHYAFYDPAAHRIEMHLVSRFGQSVRLLERRIAFEEGESIHTENSHKYTVAGFQDLALEAGFIPARVWTDEERLFSLHWLENPD